MFIGDGHVAAGLGFFGVVIRLGADSAARKFSFSSSLVQFPLPHVTHDSRLCCDIFSLGDNTGV